MDIEVGNWKEAKWQQMRPGMLRTLFSGDGVTVHIAQVDNGHDLRPHSHDSEQIIMINQGVCDFYINGKAHPMKSGSYAVIPAGVEHYIHVYESAVPVIIFDIFVPRRDEYVEQYKAFLEEK